MLAARAYCAASRVVSTCESDTLIRFGVVHSRRNANTSPGVRDDPLLNLSPSYFGNLLCFSFHSTHLLTLSYSSFPLLLLPSFSFICRTVQTSMNADVSFLLLHSQIVHNSSVHVNSPVEHRLACGFESWARTPSQSGMV